MGQISFALEKLSKDTSYDELTKRMSNAFYLSQKRINKEERSRGRKNLAIKGVGVAAVAGAGYGAYKKGIGGKYINKTIDKAKNKIYTVAEKTGREAGITAGKATNAASAAYTKTLGHGISNASKKIRGGNFIAKVLKKIILK